MKIYTDDPRVKYVTSTITPERTKAEIDEVLRCYGTYDIAWHWRPELNDVFVQFFVEEVINGIQRKVAVKVVMPVLWDKGNRNARTPERRLEQVNLTVSMRGMFHYIKNALQNAYTMQSSRVAAFLPDLVGASGKRFFDEMSEQLNRYQALEAPKEEQRDIEVIIPKNVRDVTHDSI